MTNNKLNTSTKNLIKGGIVGMGGLMVMGAMQNMPGMPKQAAGVTSIVGAGVTLGMVGGLMDVTKNILPEQSSAKQISADKPAGSSKTKKIKWM
jgi:hypothetical protein